MKIAVRPNTNETKYLCPHHPPSLKYELTATTLNEKERESEVGLWVGIVDGIVGEDRR